MVYLPSECSKASNIHFPFLSCRVAWVVADASDFSRLYVPHTSMSTASGWGQNSTESAGHSVFSLNLDMVETGRVIIEENRDEASEIRLSVSMKHKGVRGFWRSQSRVLSCAQGWKTFTLNHHGRLYSSSRPRKVGFGWDCAFHCLIYLTMLS